MFKSTSNEKRDNRDKEKDSERENKPFFFSKKNCISLALLCVKVGIIIFKRLRSSEN